MKYNVIEFSIEKTKIKGNEVVLRRNHNYRPEWYCFETSKDSGEKYPIRAVGDNRRINSYTLYGYYLNINQLNEMDLVILEPIQEIKRNAVIDYVCDGGIYFKLLRDNDFIESMTSLYEITFINDEPVKIEKI